MTPISFHFLFDFNDSYLDYFSEHDRIIMFPKISSARPNLVLSTVGTVRLFLGVVGIFIGGLCSFSYRAA